MSGPRIDNGFSDVAQSLAEEATAEQFVVLFVEHLREVSYTDFEKPDQYVHVPTLKKNFGNPEKFTEEQLRDAIVYNEGRGRLHVHRYPVPNSGGQGSKGEQYSRMTRVRITR